MREWRACEIFLVAVGLLVIFPLLGAEGREKVAEPPIAGRPDDFNGAVGSFAVVAVASPTELQAGESLTLTLTVHATGTVHKAPRRPDFKKIARLKRSFRIHDLAETEGGSPGQRRWDFSYRLQPLGSKVKEIPSLPFVYFRPHFFPPEKGYMTVYTSALPLTVKNPAQVTPEEVQGTATFPEEISRLVEGDEVLRFQGPPFVPGLLTLAGFFGAPLLVCAFWYWRWRRGPWSRASKRRPCLGARAKKALRELRTVRGKEDSFPRIVPIVNRYLRDQWQLSLEEPTPREVALLLVEAKVPERVAADAAGIFEEWDRQRFAPSPKEYGRSSENLLRVSSGVEVKRKPRFFREEIWVEELSEGAVKMAARLILDLEVTTCSPS